jgi:hypothetical protein
MKRMLCAGLLIAVAAARGDVPAAGGAPSIAAPGREPAPAVEPKTAAPRVEKVQTDGEAWNEGIDFYRAGDVTNALRVLRPLMLSRSHGPRAAEVVAALEHRLGNLEEAAGAAQIALRANPSDPKANRNFTRATDGLPALRETRHINAVLKAAQGKDPGAVMEGAVREARALMAAAGGYLTNSAARVVALSDSLSARARSLADTWIVVKETVCRSVTNETQAATIVAQVDQAQAKTKKAAVAFGDLSNDAYAALSDVEHDCTRFFKLTALPPAAIAEGLVAQSNAWQDVAAFNGRAWQQDALDYTRAFRAKFPAWAKAYEQQAQADTNKPPFTAETQAKIAALATELEKLQLECVEKILPPKQEKAVALAREIRDLLPKDSKGGNGAPPPDQKPEPNQQNGQKPNQPDPPPDGRQPENQDPPPESDKQGEEKKGDHQKNDPSVESVLMKAQERSDRHEEEKKARMRKAPLPPNERDW